VNRSLTISKSGLYGLGDTASALQTGQSLVALSQNVANKLGAKPTNQTLNEISSITGQASAIIAATGIGAPIAGALAIVSGAAQVLSSVFAGGPSSAEILQQSGGQNAALLVQIDAIDKQTDKVTQALMQLKSVLNQNGFKGLNGLGSWYDVATAGTINQSITPALAQQLADKGKNLQALIEIFNSTINETYKAIYTKKTGQSIVLASLVVLAIAGATWVTVSTLSNKNNE
jgi:hypothetical protein